MSFPYHIPWTKSCIINGVNPIDLKNFSVKLKLLSDIIFLKKKKKQHLHPHLLYISNMSLYFAFPLSEQWY